MNAENRSAPTGTASPEFVALAAEADRLRLAGQVRDAVLRVAEATARIATPEARRLRHLYDGAWWAPVESRRCRLRRRGPRDLAFIRECWADLAFMARFNRFARPLPQPDSDLEAILGREYMALPLADGGIHWTVETSAGSPFGMISLTGIERRQGRAEILVGMRELPYAGCAGEATFRALEFALGFAGLDKIEALLYAGNTSAIGNILHLGFVREGLLRQHLRDPQDGRRLDVVVAGFVREDFVAPRTARLFRRLLGRPPSLGGGPPGPAGIGPPSDAGR